MKVLKKFFYTLMILCMLCCCVVLVCAFVPGLTEQIAIKLYGDKAVQSEEENGNLQYPDYSVSSATTAGLNWDNMPFRGNGSYIVPGKEQIKAPEEARGKNGYQGIQETASDVEDEEAQKLADDLQSGSLGDELTFYDLYYPYYAMLEPSMQELYRQIYANARDLIKDFKPVVDVTENRLYTVFEAVVGDHPELFWVETGYSCKRTRDGSIVEISLSFYELSERLESAQREFENAAEVILQGARELATEAEKEKYVHDALVEQIRYSIAAPMNQSAYSALVNGETVCAGYARAFQYLMQQLGIPCYYCTGYSGEDHAWNIIYVDGLFRNVDLTWDDGDTVSYEYYNCSDKAFASTHMRKGLSVYLPACPEEGAKPQEVSALDGIRGLINPNPIEPMTLENRGEYFPEKKNSTSVSPSMDEAALRKAGITASDVLTSLDAYYKDCEAKMVKAGTGQIQFSNCIPAGLWDSVENAYSSNAYLKGYANAALKQLGAEQLAVTIQAVRLSGDYYRLYHIVATW